jgi:hypothetical protein
VYLLRYPGKSGVSENLQLQLPTSNFELGLIGTAFQLAATAGWYLPGTMRAEMDRRFQALIVATANVRSASSFSLKCGHLLVDIVRHTTIDDAVAAEAAAERDVEVVPLTATRAAK